MTPNVTPTTYSVMVLARYAPECGEVEQVLRAAGWRAVVTERSAREARSQARDEPQAGSGVFRRLSGTHRASESAGPRPVGQSERLAAVALVELRAVANRHDAPPVDVLEERAREALAHGAGQVFVEPAVLLTLLGVE